MEDFSKEKNIENYPRPVSVEGTLKILEQMQRSICKVYMKEGGSGTGFFCYIPYENIKIPVLITNNHIINDNYIKNNNKIIISLNNDKKEDTILLNEQTFYYTSEEYDTTIIELKKDKIDDNYNLMELDEKLFFENSDFFYKKTSAYIIQYPNKQLAVSYGIINSLDKFNIIHLCSTDKGSSGSPILNLSNNKIIGIHKLKSENFNANFGTLLKYPINKFIKEYKQRKILGADIFFNSSIIKEKEDSNFIIDSLLKKIKFKNIELIYCASKNGNTCKDFKNHCNNKGSTLLVVKTKDNEIFGGFTKCDWTNDNFKYGNDKDAFLYSITNKKVFDILKPEKAIINYSEDYAFGCFGNTNDWDGLYFFEQPYGIEGYNNYKKLTNIYDIKNSNDLCKERLFKAIEMEVYQIK